MSTFKGLVAEFPDIRIDYFRTIPGVTPPLACFLSHVHSDHLQGLESLKAPFIYCSPATRELLLRLEKYPHRMNFAKGILECRKQHYKHLKNLLKTIPLETPTWLELSPGREVRVTLFDANHCVGAVMFLIEDESNAILYTGDVRAEPWWVNTLTRNPILIPYTLGGRRLDRIYLDTTFATKTDIYRTFPTKGDGLKELLSKTAQYPEETVFHFNAWTFGYEQVWVALCSALRSQMHVDSYKMRLYKSLAGTRDCAPTPEASALTGFKCGNRHHPGCLTSDPAVRLHGCERGTTCMTVEHSNKVVYIIPILSRLENGLELPEVGAGGGHGDLLQTHELELSDITAVGLLMNLCKIHVHDVEAFARVCSLISSAMLSRRQVLSLESELLDKEDTMPLTGLISLLVKEAEQQDEDGDEGKAAQFNLKTLPQRITFPYSRHSSYEELCHLVEAFHPRDIYPCTTVDEEQWTNSLSMQTLFGYLCSDNKFAHDQEMIAAQEARGITTSKKRPAPESSPRVDSSPRSRRSQTSEASPAPSQSYEQHVLSRPSLKEAQRLSLPVQSEAKANHFSEIQSATNIVDEHGYNHPDAQAVKERNQRLHAIQEALKNRLKARKPSNQEPRIETSTSQPQTRRSETSHNTSHVNVSIEETVNLELANAQIPHQSQSTITTLVNTTTPNNNSNESISKPNDPPTSSTASLVESQSFHEPYQSNNHVSESQAQLDDFYSNYSDDSRDQDHDSVHQLRLEDRRDAFRAALTSLYNGGQDAAGTWADFALLSAGNNHTHEEEEL